MIQPIEIKRVNRDDCDGNHKSKYGFVWAFGPMITNPNMQSEYLLLCTDCIVLLMDKIMEKIK